MSSFLCLKLIQIINIFDITMCRIFVISFELAKICKRQRVPVLVEMLVNYFIYIPQWHFFVCCIASQTLYTNRHQYNGVQRSRFSNDCTAGETIIVLWSTRTLTNTFLTFHTSILTRTLQNFPALLKGNSLN